MKPVLIFVVAPIAVVVLALMTVPIVNDGTRLAEPTHTINSEESPSGACSSVDVTVTLSTDVSVPPINIGLIRSTTDIRVHRVVATTRLDPDCAEPDSNLATVQVGHEACTEYSSLSGLIAGDPPQPEWQQLCDEGSAVRVGGEQGAEIPAIFDPPDMGVAGGWTLSQEACVPLIVSFEFQDGQVFERVEGTPRQADVCVSIG